MTWQEEEVSEQVIKQSHTEHKLSFHTYTVFLKFFNLCRLILSLLG